MIHSSVNGDEYLGQKLLMAIVTVKIRKCGILKYDLEEKSLKVLS